ncbi:YopX family protein [Brevibacillus fortis]|uniref:YopX protein domain-containing protein n=1 Tax=Brevibacillus fortis TaxID=2126352 RepID=A0A2P7V3U1_9BACL|nr:YopX family protein [Brevibacillus fortis]PSJ93865.1 hypothetical protein C7R93_16925 [Brevibacillus fortis]
MQAGREVKYQIWIEPTREMKTVTALLFDDDGQLFGVKTPDSEVNSCLSIHTVRVRQFTGLSDKNGKEIYEGDLVEISDHPFEGPVKVNGIYEVGYNERMELCCGSWLLHRELPYIMVVGNKYVNPELLEVGK